MGKSNESKEIEQKTEEAAKQAKTREKKIQQRMPRIGDA